MMNNKCIVVTSHVSTAIVYIIQGVPKSVCVFLNFLILLLPRIVVT